MVINGYRWLSTVIDVYRWLSMLIDVYRSLSTSIDVCGGSSCEDFHIFITENLPGRISDSAQPMDHPEGEVQTPETKTMHFTPTILGTF